MLRFSSILGVIFYEAKMNALWLRRFGFGNSSMVQFFSNQGLILSADMMNALWFIRLSI